MKYSWTTFVILGIWLSISIILIGRESVQPDAMLLFVTVATIVISFLGFR